MRALEEVLEFVVDRFDPLGVIAAGSIVRGTPDASSDLDLYVIHAQPWRQRLQRFFDGTPAEIFVTSPAAVERYLEEEAKAGRQITAHMLATGRVLVDRDPVVERLRVRARDELAKRPEPTEVDLTWRRYEAALHYEDAMDRAGSDPATCAMILPQAVEKMLEYAFWKARRFLPRRKDLLDAVAAIDPELAADARAFYSDTRRIDLAGRIADRTIETRGFFAWDSEQEPFP